VIPNVRSEYSEQSMIMANRCSFNNIFLQNLEYAAQSMATESTTRLSFDI